MFQMPMSSPMIMMMLGCCCAAAGALAAMTAANDASRPRQSFLAIFMNLALNSGCPKRAGSRRPVTTVFTCRKRRCEVLTLQPKGGDVLLRLGQSSSSRPSGDIVHRYNRQGCRDRPQDCGAGAENRPLGNALV